MVIFQNRISGRRRACAFFLSGGLLLGIVALNIGIPPGFPFSECGFHALTGHSCLTCGMTRSLHAVAQGELLRSLRFHLFGPAVFIIMLCCLGVFGFEAMSGKQIRVSWGCNAKPRIVSIFALSWIVYWGIRLLSEFG